MDLPHKPHLISVAVAVGLIIAAANPSAASSTAKIADLANLPMTRASLGPVGEQQVMAGLNNYWTKVIDKKDAKAAAEIYADDGSLYVPGAPPITGRSAMLAMWQETFQIPGFRLELQTTKTTFSKSGDIAVDVGNYTLKTGKTKTPFVENGKYVVTWIKRNGTWRVLTDTLSPGRPAAEGETAAIR